MSLFAVTSRCEWSGRVTNVGCPIFLGLSGMGLDPFSIVGDSVTEVDQDAR
jgi:hypothetical protein